MIYCMILNIDANAVLIAYMDSEHSSLLLFWYYLGILMNPACY